MKTSENAQIYQMLCAELRIAVKASTNAAVYANEAADNAVVVANHLVDIENENMKTAQEFAATTAKHTVTLAENLALVNLNDAKKLADDVAAKVVHAARTLENKAQAVAEMVLFTANKLQMSGKQRTAEALKLAIAASNAAAGAAAAAAAAAADKFCVHSTALITLPSVSPRN